MEVPTHFIREEHAELLPETEKLRLAAEKVDTVSDGRLLELMDDALQFLNERLIPHAKAEDAVLYPEVERLLGARGATDTMVLDHEEVKRLTDEVARFRDRVALGLRSDPEDAEMRRLLYGLLALITLHFHKEEVAYLPLLDARLNLDEGEKLFEAMEAAGSKFPAAAG